MVDIILQTAGEGRYTGPLIHGRFQVLETILKGRFMLADHQNGGLPVMVKDEVVRYGSQEEAEDHAAQLATGKAPTRPPAHAGTDRKQASGGQETAAATFRRLILQGDLTDDQIFAEVQKIHGLPANRRAYVQWYRNDLMKKGQLKKS